MYHSRHPDQATHSFYTDVQRAAVCFDGDREEGSPWIPRVAMRGVRLTWYVDYQNNLLKYWDVARGSVDMAPLPSGSGACPYGYMFDFECVV